MMEKQDERGSWVDVGVGDGGCKEGAPEVLLLHPSSLTNCPFNEGVWGVHMS